MKIKKLLVCATVLLTIFLMAPASHAVGYYAWIGTVDFDDDHVNDFSGDPAETELYNLHYISQEITASSFSVSYNFFSNDMDDWDSFSIYLDDLGSTPIFTIYPQDLPGDPFGLKSSGWTQFAYDFGAEETHTVYFALEVDDFFQSWVFIDDAVPFSNGDFETADLSGWTPSGQTGHAPLPGSFWLLCTGLVGLAALYKKRRV